MQTPSVYTMEPDLDTIAPIAARTDESARLNLEKANAERAECRPDLPPIEPVLETASEDVVRALVDTVKELAAKGKLRQFPTPERQKRDIDELFIAPSAAERVFKLQAKESEDAEEIADRIAEVCYGAENVGAIPERREQASCRFLATHALRLSKDYWQRAAREHATQAAAEWMKTEGGAVFVGCSERQIQQMAGYLSAAVLRGYLGITEGSSALYPGKYLAIVEGRR